MEEVIKKLLSAGNKFITEINFRQPGFTYSACGSVTKKKERLQRRIKVYRSFSILYGL